MPVNVVLNYQNGDAFRSLDQQQVLDWLRGYQVVNPGGGSNAVTLGGGDYELNVAPGDVNVGGTVVSAAAETLDLSTAVDIQPRVAVIYRDTNGDAQFEAGTAQAREPEGDDVRSSFRPPAPTLFDIDGTPLAEVLLDGDVGEITSELLRDRRVPAELVVANIAADTADLDSATVAALTLEDLETLEPAAEPATPSGDDVALWNDSNAVKAKFSDGTTATIAQE